MTDTSYLTPDGARNVFDEWIAGQTTEYTDINNARFQIVFDRGTIRCLML